MARFSFLLLAMLFGMLCALESGRTSVQAADSLPQVVEFNRDIRPILSDNCFQCHGPDKAKRKADLRLDTEEGAFAKLRDDEGHSIVRGKPGDSELFRRVSITDERKRMPPAKSGRKLSERQIELLRRWIEQGGKWQKHWAFITPKRPDTPQVKNQSWPRNPIDHFILARLEQEGMTPAPEADRATLVRRVTLDLTGLPPTPDEVERALNDKATDWYEKVVDRLLRSPRYGERMAVRWLDAARYADTSGYQSDGERYMWRWRDWVIDAFNNNVPFDRFTIEQIAGDMLPNATLEQKIATGFNRNHRGNAEGGIVPEEYAVEYVVDRVDTTATVWLGLTMGCVRCHDHKFDPISQKEYYRLFAYFNNVPEFGRAIKYGNSPPYIKAPTADQQEKLRKVEVKLAEAEKHFAGLASQLDEARKAWEKTVGKDDQIEWSPTAGLLLHYPPADANLLVPHKPKAAAVPSFIDGRPAFTVGKLGLALDLDGKRYVDAGDVADFGFYDRFSIAAWINPASDHGTIVSRMKDADLATGYQLRLYKGKLQLNLVVRWLDDSLRVESERALPPGEWHHVAVTYDGTRLASGVRIYVDGKPEKVHVVLDELNQTFKTKEPVRIGAGGGPDGRFQGQLDDVRIYREVLAPDEVGVVATTDSITAIAAMPAEKRSAGQALKLRAYFLDKQAPSAIQQAYRQVLELRKQRAQLEEDFPTVMVMEEMPKPRETHVLQRGVYDKPGEKVGPGVPASLTPLPNGAPNNRIGLGRWLVDPANPLTARVAVNRFWQMYFGTGLVKTVDDFGAQGEWPSHPELLDWLATEFIRTGWDVKQMQKTIAMSASYRQSSRVTPELLQKDPENRLMSRGPRYRLPAEMIRDQALFASGLLVEKLGGPSVKPYQPAGLWKELTGAEEYTADRGADLYRRSMYTFWKRTVAPPAMITFDAAGRETCIVRETRTNTPLQALTLMNDVTYVEASRVLAQRVMKEAGPSPDERITLAFRLVTGRKPRPAELKILHAGLEHHLAEYRKDSKAALKLVSAGEYPRDAKLDPAELAAYTAIAGLILNLDETITKE